MPAAEAAFWRSHDEPSRTRSGIRRREMAVAPPPPPRRRLDGCSIDRGRGVGPIACPALPRLSVDGMMQRMGACVRMDTLLFNNQGASSGLFSRRPATLVLSTAGPPRAAWGERRSSQPASQCKQGDRPRTDPLLICARARKSRVATCGNSPTDERVTASKRQPFIAQSSSHAHCGLFFPFGRGALAVRQSGLDQCDRARQA